jgi:hypothetical protein
VNDDRNRGDDQREMNESFSDLEYKDGKQPENDESTADDDEHERSTMMLEGAPNDEERRIPGGDAVAPVT